MSTLTTPHAQTADRQIADTASAKDPNFAERLIAMYNDASLALMISLGHRTGLFDRMAEMNWATSVEIAAVAELSERYVREWLGAMVTGRIVDYDPKRRKYRLPAERAGWLTRAAAPDNMAVIAQFVGLLGRAEPDVLEAFKTGRGVAYCKYPEFHTIMAEESGQSVVAGLLDHILPLIPEALERLEAGIDVLDVGCGSGYAMNFLAEHFPQSRFVGYDYCDDAIATARAEAQRRSLRNVRFEQKDATRLGESSCYDMIVTFDAIHDQAFPDLVLRGIREGLRPNGVYLMQEIGASSHLEKNIDHPLGGFIFTVSCMHCMSVSLAQGGIGLGAAWGEELAEQMLREAGFEDITAQRLDHDILNTYFVARP